MTANGIPTHAVLMGDIVGSENAPSVEAVHRAFNEVIDAANADHAAAIASPLTITLGDEFQGLLRRLVHAWDVAAAARLRLLLADVQCRFVIGVVHVATPVNSRQAWNMMGPGFGAARDKLNDKASTNAYRFSLPGDPLVESLLDAVGDALTHVEIEWTPTQLAYFAATRAVDRTNVEIAKGLGVSPRSLYKVLHAARAEFHERLSGVVRNALRNLDERYALP